MQPTWPHQLHRAVSVLSCLLTYACIICSSFPPQASADMQYNCSKHSDLYKQIHKDLERWKTQGFTKDLKPNVTKLCTYEGVMAHWPCDLITVLIQGGQVFVTSNASRISAEKARYYSLAVGQLLELYEASLLYKLPNVEFALVTGDDFYPDIHKFMKKHYQGKEPLLLMSNRHDDQPAALMPHWHFACYHDSTDSLMTRLAEFDKVPWSQRKPVGFSSNIVFCPHYLRYAPTKFDDGMNVPCARTHLNQLSVKHPDLLDFRDAAKGWTPFIKQSEYKYGVYTDGWSTSTKLEKMFVAGVAVLKQQTPKFPYFEHMLKPYEHYVPYYKHNATDILQAIQWLQSHENEAYEIAQNGRNFALEHLTRPARLCYWYELLQSIAKLTKYKPSCSMHDVCLPVREELEWLYKHAPGSCEVERLLKDIERGRNPIVT